jgi:hypothetical protein
LVTQIPLSPANIMKGPEVLRLVGAGASVGVSGANVSVGGSGEGLGPDTGDCSVTAPVGVLSTSGVTGRGNTQHIVEKINVKNRMITFR